MGLLSWSGHGWIGFVVIFASVAIGLAVPEQYSLLVIGAGFIAGGIAMLLAGRAWNGDGANHRFCNMRVQRWVYVFVPLGLILGLAGFNRARMEDPRTHAGLPHRP
jgi:hypothetical protein